MTRYVPFHWHLAVLAATVLLGLFTWAHSDTRRQKAEALLATASFFIVLSWPIGDISRSVSLSVAVTQRLVLMLLVVPLTLRRTPMTYLEQITRPAVCDAVVRRVSHPGVALLLVTILGTWTVTPIMIDWAAHSVVGHVINLALVVVAGVILWIPGLGCFPGTRRLSAAGRAGFLFAASLLVTSLSFVWIFSTHAFYPGLHYQHEVLHLTPVLDQQFAGFAAKLGAYVPLWAVAFYVFFHAEDQGIPVEDTPLHWADVERELLRVDRARARALRRHQPS